MPPSVVDRTLRFQAMFITDFFGTTEVTDKSVLDTILSRRHNLNVNTFWLDIGQEFPVLMIFVRDELASLIYLARDGHSGYASRGSIPELDPDGLTMFYMGVGEEQEMANCSIVPITDAVRAAHEFLSAPELPKSIKWYDLDANAMVVSI
jgi:hypothetical protein